MKRRKLITYILSMLIPIIIFFIATTLSGYVPIKDAFLNSYDSFTQYPGFLLEFIRGLKLGNIFYSWKAGLGFNLFGSITYYALSPLNLSAFFANSSNYHIYIAIMTYIRFALLGGSMCFYLDHKDVKSSYTILFSVIYALMGYTATYYYNYIWIDSVIMLPLVIYGLDKLIDECKPLFYIITLSITIFINYYTGYMICIFSLIWFIYRILCKKEKKKPTKQFIVSSLIAGCINAVIILPSMFALLRGKASLYNSVDYGGISKNFLTFFYTLTSGSFRVGDQMNGPALVFVTLLTVILVFFYFFNKKFSLKEKILTGIILIFFYLSFSINFINYAWHMFQKPIWWPSRFSFLFSFFLITIASKSLMNIKSSKVSNKVRIITSIVFSILVIAGAIFKWQDIATKTTVYMYIFIGFSIMLFIEEIFLVDKKSFIYMIMIFTMVELSLNTFVSVKNNDQSNDTHRSVTLKEEVPKYIEKLNKENEYFYRMELIDGYSSLDGLYFGFNGIDYFNSARNMNTLNFLKKIGVDVLEGCNLNLSSFDPVLLSLLNIKYLYGYDLDYYKKIDTRLFENSYPLALGFMVNSDIKDVTLGDEPNENKEMILKAMTGLDKSLYRTIKYDDFERHDKEVLKYSFKSDDRYLVVPNISGSITIDNKKTFFDNEVFIVDKKSEVEIEYDTSLEIPKDEIYLTLLRLDAYEEYMHSIDGGFMDAHTNTNGHILEGTVHNNGKYDYLYTSIEYEEGMTVYLDGEKVEPDILFNALIGLPISEGEHTITIDYIPKGLKLGSVISIISLVSLVVYLQILKKEI